MDKKGKSRLEGCGLDLLKSSACLTFVGMLNGGADGSCVRCFQIHRYIYI